MAYYERDSFLKHEARASVMSPVPVPHGLPATDTTSTAVAWQPGVAKRFPLLGFGALLGGVCAIAAAGVILWVSEGQETSRWNVQPAVLLAIMSAIGTALFGLAQSQGATFAWWTSALRGSTLSDLHKNWEMGTGIWASLTSLHHLSPVSTAKLGVAACFAIGPLLQRATVVTTVPATSSLTLDIAAATTNSTLNITLPNIFTSEQGNTFFTHATPELVAIISDFLERRPINLTATATNTCDGTCSGKIHGPGIVGRCESVSERRDWAEEILVTDSDSHSATLLNVTFLDKRFRFRDPLSASLFMFNVTYFTADGLITKSVPPLPDQEGPGNFSYEACPGTLWTKVCTYDLAVVEYDVLITNSTITYQDGPRPEISKTTFVTANSTSTTPTGYAHIGMPGIYGLLGSFIELFSSSILYVAVTTSHSADYTNNRTIGEVNWRPSVTGNKYSQELFSILDTQCYRSFPDPTDEILNSMTDILFRIGIAAANYPPYQTQQVAVTQTRQALVFQTSYVYLYVAAGLAAFATIVTGFTFHGFWRLGRAVTLSPIETARALDKGLFRQTGTNLEVEEILEMVGATAVRYGVADGKLVLGGGEVRKPEKGEVLG